ncbi:golgin subfamily A member 6-like protein 22 [Papaver somniferum]|uniref:golgin subfamily A member 6-like protein 22 n=1 Tax=Papaver somniferum TaxID=3469 RepID=UPI000E702498|nr:golgin subfamily A member 6-like protein 22 [Papaver somniferum]
MTARRSKRIAERRRGEIENQPEVGIENIQGNGDPIGAQRTQEQNNPIDYDRVSMLTSQTDSTEENEQRDVEMGMIERDDNTIAELRQRLIAERRREDEIHANLIRQNDDLREENLTLQDRRSRIATSIRSRSRNNRSLSRQSKSNQEHDRRERNLGVVDENLQLDDNQQDRYEQPREHHHRRENQRIDMYQNAGERHHHNEEHGPEQGRSLLYDREMLRDQYAREGEEERNNQVRERERAENGRRRRIREETGEIEIQEAIRQNNHENRLRQARLKIHMQYNLDQSMSEEILKEMAELREMMVVRKMVEEDS